MEEEYYNPLAIADRIIGTMTHGELLVLRRWIDDELDYLEYLDTISPYLYTKPL